MILAAWYHTIFAFFFAVLAILLMIVILLQRGKGVGLAGAFGGTGGTTAFGAKTGDILTWVTIIGAALLLTYTVVLNFVFVDVGPGLRSQQVPPPPTQTPAGPGTQGGPTAPPSPAPTPTPQPAPTSPGAALWDQTSDGRLMVRLPIFGEERA